MRYTTRGIHEQTEQEGSTLLTTTAGREVWKRGGYVIYHHDMFQTGYDTPAVPPHGIPDPEWDPYHRSVFEFLAQRERYMPPHLRPEAR